MSDSLITLEWPEILKVLISLCWTPYGELLWEKESFLESKEAMIQHQAEVTQLKNVLERFGDPILPSEFSPGRLFILTPIIERLKRGGTLTQEELTRVHQTLALGQAIIDHVSRSHLEALAVFEETSTVPELVKLLNDHLEGSGQWKESASEIFFGLKKALRHKRQQIQAQLEQYTRNPEFRKYLQDATITERDGRYVLPVQASFKNQIPGYIHDISASGSTVFIEPESVMALNQGLIENQRAIQAEIERLLQVLSEQLATHTEVMETFVEVLGFLDKRMAAARLSIQIHGNPVDISDAKQHIQLKNFRHPLLLLQRRAKGEQNTVVPNSVSLGEAYQSSESHQAGITYQTIVITGPNTGGKTVVLKSLGLLALMLKAGLHLPVSENSSMSVFSPVLADIGDQQSITQNLSTFSAHVANLKRFVDPALNLSEGLILLDEIAAGTDPAEGAALAKAVLHTLYEKGALTIVTTHLGELKVEAHQHPGYLNASVAFDLETLSPTYELLVGMPGASNALTIAESLGLSAEVIELARQNLHHPAGDVAGLLETLERQKHQIEQDKETAQVLLAQAKIDAAKAQSERQELELEKRQLLQRFRAELKGKFHRLREEMKDVEKQWRSGKQQKTARFQTRLQSLGSEADSLLEHTEADIEAPVRLTLEELSVGQEVFSTKLNLVAKVLVIIPQQNAVQLEAGLLKMTVPIDDLQPKPGSRQSKKRKIRSAEALSDSPSVQLQEKSYSLVCDVRGLRADEALIQLDRFMDEVVLAGYERVSVVHGLGSGALKKAIRERLKELSFVKRFYPAQATEGGDGKTVVEL